MATTTAPNFEEASNVATEFITSLDNLPNEVQHLLQEIKIKEQRCQELQHDITKDEVKYVKKSLKQTSIPSTPSSSGQNSRTASPAPNPKAHLPGRISAAYAELDTLSNEKIVLSQRIIELLGRTRARLDADISKVRLLQGESPEEIRASANAYLSTAAQLRAASPFTTKREGSVLGLTPVIQIGDSLRSAVTALPIDASLSISAVGPGYNKKRRLTTTTSIKLPSPAPQTISHSGAGHGRSRLSRQSQVSRAQHHQEEEDLDADAEGEEDVEGEDAEDDTTPYCFCQKPSYGDMIGCDNDDCPFQWFHISCVGVKQPLPDKWYCPDCIGKYAKAAEKRKGRKK